MADYPLADVTIVDLTRVLAGPYCTMLLADLGARVIKVERPGRGDDARHIGPFLNGHSAYFASVNRGKESIDLDFESENDRLLLDRLLDRADVLVENFKGGTLARLGYGWPVLHERWPRLVYAAISGFGHTGPYAERPAYDMIVQAMGGIMSITGPEQDDPSQTDSRAPTRVGTSVGDLTAGLFGAIGILSALHDRERTGEGRKVDVSMLDCQVAILENALARYFATGTAPGPLGARHPSITPFGAFAAADGHLVIAAGNDQLFVRLCEVLGSPALAADARFATNGARTEHESELKGALQARLAGATVAVWLDRLASVGVPCGPINDVAAVVHDPQVRARSMVLPLDDPELPGLHVAGNPVKMSGLPEPGFRRRAPRLGEHRVGLVAETNPDA
ncbi:MAG: CoA transferase [Acidimicrobiales bacterium]